MKRGSIEYRKQRRLDRAFLKDRARRPEYWKAFFEGIKTPKIEEIAINIFSKQPIREPKILAMKRYEDKQ